MEKNELLLKLNAEQLLSRVIRYNKLVNINAPEIVRASELQMILESLCKAVNETNEYPVQLGKTSHKDFIKKTVLEKWVRHQNQFFKNASEETLVQLKYNANRGLLSRAEEITKVVEDEKEEIELEQLYMNKRVTDIEIYKVKKMFEELF
jgi:hypothetical protein